MGISQEFTHLGSVNINVGVLHYITICLSPSHLYCCKILFTKYMFVILWMQFLIFMCQISVVCTLQPILLSKDTIQNLSTVKFELLRCARVYSMSGVLENLAGIVFGEMASNWL